jgi:threonine dehydrogenase-like Zn-dependent dehydrogenase
MAAMSANIRGAAHTFVVDFQADRLAPAAKLGATPIDLFRTDAAEVIMDAADGFGVDCGVEAVGYQAHALRLHPGGPPGPGPPVGLGGGSSPPDDGPPQHGRSRRMSSSPARVGRCRHGTTAGRGALFRAVAW